MASSVPTLVQRQIARVGRRLFFQTLLDCLVWCWAGALVLSAVWFLLQPLVLTTPPEWLRWTVAGGCVGVGAILAVVLAVVRAPSRLAAALSMDEKFNLRERVTTSLTLLVEMQSTAAGQALLEDVNQRVAKIDVAEKFPVRMSWQAVLVPVAAVLLVMVALFYQPNTNQANANSVDEAKQPIANQADIEKKKEKLAKKPSEIKPGEPQEKSEKMKEIDADLEKIVNKPTGNKEQLRQLAKDMTDLEADMKKREKELREKSNALKEQLKNLGRMNKDGKNEGPAKELEKAMEKGDYNKAIDEVEKLAKKLENNELTEKEREQMAKQLENLQQKMEKLAKNSEKEEKLKELARKGQIDQETLEREMQELKKNSENLKELSEIAKEMKKAQEAAKKGDNAAVAKALKKAGEQLKDMEGESKEIDELAERLDDLQDLKNMVGKSMDSGPNQGGRGSGRRPEDKSGDTKSLPSRVNLDFDTKGKKEISDFVPGNSFKKKPSKEMAGEISQASQEAAEAREHQKVDRAAKEMFKGYFENLRKDVDPTVKDVKTP
jgi:hypothetical protein